MDAQTSIAISDSYRKAGWTAIASGVIGIAAFGLLMIAVTTRASWIPSDKVWMLFNTHDLGVALQFLLLLFAIFGLRTLADQTPPGLGKAAFATGVWAVIFVVLFVLLGVGGKIVSNGLYMFPQGILGAWLIAANWRLSGALPAWQRWFGMIVGLGLVLTGVCFVGITCVYFPDSLAIPAVSPENIKEVISPANTFFHQLLPISAFMGVATLPLWTILTGYQLLKKRRPAYA
jgi:hypothetical protein